MPNQPLLVDIHREYMEYILLRPARYLVRPGELKLYRYEKNFVGFHYADEFSDLWANHYRSGR